MADLKELEAFYIKCKEAGEGNARLLHEIEISLQEGRESAGLENAIQEAIREDKAALARNEQALQEIAAEKQRLQAQMNGIILKSYLGELLPAYLPTLAGQQGKPKS